MSAAAVTVIVTKPGTRPYLCPICGRHLGVTTAIECESRLKCPDCRKWVVVRIGDGTR